MAARATPTSIDRVYLLLDECCGRALIRRAEQLGHTAQRTIEVAALGRQASDRSIFERACQTGAVLVTINRGDFVALASRRPHPGVIVLPSVPLAQSVVLFSTVLAAAEPLIAKSHSMIIEITVDGTVESLRIP